MMQQETQQDRKSFTESTTTNAKIYINICTVCTHTVHHSTSLESSRSLFLRALMIIVHITFQSIDRTSIIDQ